MAFIASASAATIFSGRTSPVRAVASDIPNLDDFLGFDESLVVSKTKKERRDNGKGSIPRIIIPRTAEDRTLIPDDDDAAAASANVQPFHPRPAAKVAEDDETVGEGRFIGGTDDRYHDDDPTFPSRSVGRIVWTNGVFCSGALVGPRHVLTAKHCAIDDGSEATFEPGYDNGERFGTGNVVMTVVPEAQVPGSPCETKMDWAVFLLDEPLGDGLGWFGVMQPDATRLDSPIFHHMGYPGDIDGGSAAQRIDNVSILSGRTFDCDATGPIYTDADTAGGQSGGPVWMDASDGNSWIWGALSIGVSEGDGSVYSGFASGIDMINAINQLRAEYP
jgi:V8-like Glu-specific endopeptidase